MRENTAYLLSYNDIHFKVARDNKKEAKYDVQFYFNWPNILVFFIGLLVILVNDAACSLRSCVTSDISY
jgi:hypothetical protein